MTQEDKQLLLKDLSARLPYSPKVEIDSSYTNAREVVPLNHSMLQDAVIKNFDVIPYLRPMSSMTEVEESVLSLCNAFIEKACSGIKKLLSGYIIRNFHFGDSYDIDKLIEDFKDYVKGE